MASVYQRLGTNVTVVEFLDEICPSLDKELAKAFNKVLTKQGIKILTGHKVTGGKNHGTYAEINIQPVKGGDSQVLKADHVLVATGRRPFTEGLGLDKAGVKAD
jgi:dihydrolipoamide dehydrogenase